MYIQSVYLPSIALSPEIEALGFNVGVKLGQSAIKPLQSVPCSNGSQFGGIYMISGKVHILVDCHQ